MAGKGYLTTHILDTAQGVPAANVKIELFRMEGEQRRHIASALTNSDGRTDKPLIPAGELEAGNYELVFAMGEYFFSMGVGASIPFVGDVPIRFGIADPESHYHVPLLASPFSYSTYRGS